jgi:hypothetical protein
VVNAAETLGPLWACLDGAEVGAQVFPALVRHAMLHFQSQMETPEGSFSRSGGAAVSGAGASR